MPELAAAAVFSLSLPPTAFATDLSNEDSGFEEDVGTLCWDPETAAGAAVSCRGFAPACLLWLDGAADKDLALSLMSLSDLHDFPDNSKKITAFSGGQPHYSS